jgi:hypothetical protein
MSYEPTEDELRVIAWLRKEAGLSEVACTIVTLTRAAHWIEQGTHHDG